MHHLDAYPTNHHQICMRGASLFVQRFSTESIGKWFGSVLATEYGESRQHHVLPHDTSSPKAIKIEANCIYT